jgi:hypothetical protein
MSKLRDNIDKIHTTPLGIERIKRNLEREIDDVETWCKKRITNTNEISQKGKNFYIHTENIVITINAHSYTIITAHKKKR